MKKVLLLVVVLVILSIFKISRSYLFFSVLSGSMEPSIKMGSVVLVKPQNNYQKGDIITVIDSENLKVPITHRIFSVEEATTGAIFQTKGDANNTSDIEKRFPKDILGKVDFSIPFFGYISSYGKTRDGLIFLVIIPLTIIIYHELMTIKNETTKLFKKKKNG